MGKIKVIGVAKREYAVDRCDISISFEATRETSDEASKATTDQCERLLYMLEKKGVSPKNVKVKHDRIAKKTAYDTGEISYESEKELLLKTDADAKNVNVVRDIIETGFEDVTLSTFYSISNESDLRRELLKDAILDSKNKAETLADAMGKLITGIDTANLSGDDDYFDLPDESEHEEVCYMRAYGTRSLSDELQPNKQTLSAEVTIVWLLE